MDDAIDRQDGSALTDINHVRDLPKPLVQALDYWDGLCGDSFAPPLKSFDLLALDPKVIPSTVIIDIHEPLDQSVYRFWGSRMTQVYGRDMTGRRPYDIHTPEFGRLLVAKHERLLTEKKATSSHFRFTSDNEDRRSHTVLRLPLSDDGERVTHIVVVSDYSREALQRIAESGLKFTAMVEAIDG